MVILPFLETLQLGGLEDALLDLISQSTSIHRSIGVLNGLQLAVMFRE